MLFTQDYVCNKKPDQSTIVSVDKGEPRKKHYLHNTSKCSVYQYQLDGGIITDSPESLNKCDFIIEANPGKKIVYFVELKGRKIGHAFKQLEGTASLFCTPEKCAEFRKVYIGDLTGFEVHARIITTDASEYKKTPKTHERAFLDQIQKLKHKYQIQFNAKEKIVRQAQNPEAVDSI